MRPDLKPLLLAALRIALGAAFAYAALSKVPDMAQFAEETANYRLLPAQLVPSFTVALAGVEVLAGVLLLLGVAVRPAAAVTAAMLVAFIVALSQALLRGIDLRCGCFGGEDLATWGTVARDVVMVAACLPLWKWGGGSLAFWRRAAPAA